MLSRLSVVDKRRVWIKLVLTVITVYSFHLLQNTGEEIPFSPMTYFSFKCDTWRLSVTEDWHRRVRLLEIFYLFFGELDMNRFCQT